MLEDVDSNSSVFLFVHISKTGGQTFRDFFVDKLKFHEEFIHLGPYGFRAEAELGLKPFAERTPEERGKAKIILGHEVNESTSALVPNKTARYVVFLRDPAEQVLSQYNFNRATKEGVPPTFEEWYAQTNSANPMTLWLVGRFPRTLDKICQLKPELSKGQSISDLYQDAVRKGDYFPFLWVLNVLLSRFWFVGCTEQIDRDSALLLRKMGLEGQLEHRNVSGEDFPKSLEMTDDLRLLLYSRSPLDLLLYRFWSRKRELWAEQVSS